MVRNWAGVQMLEFDVVFPVVFSCLSAMSIRTAGLSHSETPPSKRALSFSEAAAS